MIINDNHYHNQSLIKIAVLKFNGYSFKERQILKTTKF